MRLDHLLSKENRPQLFTTVRLGVGIKLLFNFEGVAKGSRTDKYGGVAQLGEHLPCKQGVMGSNPIISTKGERTRYTEITNGLIAQVVRAHA